MKKLLAVLAIASVLSVGPVASSAQATTVCTKQIVAPLTLPINVCVTVPDPIVSTPPITIPPITVPPVVVPPVTAPAAPAHPTVPSKPASPAVPHTILTVPQPTPAHTPSPADKAQERFEELGFPFAIAAVLIAIMFGGYELSTFFEKRKAKRVADGGR